jgi:hypothetical protein
MDKKVLKERLDDVRKQLRTNAKDVHFFDKLIDEALSLKGQMGVGPIALDCGKEEDEWKGETFRITLTSKGVLYHEYGGYSVFVTPNNSALYDVLSDLVINKEEYATLEDEKKENFESLLAIIAYNLSLPRIAFLDKDFPQEIALKTMSFLQKMYEDLMNKELQEETPKEDTEFKEATLAIEDLKSSLDKDVKK